MVAELSGENKHWPSKTASKDAGKEPESEEYRTRMDFLQWLKENIGSLERVEDQLNFFFLNAVGSDSPARTLFLIENKLYFTLTKRVTEINKSATNPYREIENRNWRYGIVIDRIRTFLVKEGWVAPRVTNDHLRSVFPLDVDSDVRQKPSAPIRWCTAPEYLLYFLQQLKNNFIGEHNRPGLYEIAFVRFVDIYGQSFPQSLRERINKKGLQLEPSATKVKDSISDLTKTIMEVLEGRV